MSTETGINAIETVKKKIEKYVSVKQNDKVKEYLLKLQTTSVTPKLLQDTRIDVFVNQLTLDKTTTYYPIAKKLVEKWQNKNLVSKSTNSSKAKTSINTNKDFFERKSINKRKSLDDDVTHSSTLSESQSSDEYKTNDRDQSSSSTKKRKVISLAEYTGSKKPVVNPIAIEHTSAAVESDDIKLTDTEREQIYAQFVANGEEFAAKAPVVAQDLDKKLTKPDIIHSNRNGFIANGHVTKSTTNNKPKTNGDEFWNELSDDDEDVAPPPKKQVIAQSKPVKTNRITSNTQQTKKSTTATTTVSNKKPENHPIVPTVTTNTTHSEHSRPSAVSRPIQSQAIVPPKKTADTINFLRSKHGRQAIYSGKRTLRTTIPSLQDLCVETLKDNVEMSCHTYFNRLPFEIVKPILDATNPEQLKSILYNNPDYVDECEPLWKQFCERSFKDAERDECETFYELYWRKVEENEERLQRITENARKKRAETVDTARHTKPLNTRIVAPSQIPQAHRITRQVVGLPPTKALRGQQKVKKPTVPPLLRKTLQFYKGKS